MRACFSPGFPPVSEVLSVPQFSHYAALQWFWVARHSGASVQKRVGGRGRDVSELGAVTPVYRLGDSVGGVHTLMAGAIEINKGPGVLGQSNALAAERELHDALEERCCGVLATMVAPTVLADPIVTVDSEDEGDAHTATDALQGEVLDQGRVGLIDRVMADIFS
ncbi:hypothetical protein NDU88_004310 [Pleurodeles waltl]|uniref:Uncharacterized protein n=1 Tax=Pleurodeles waltl TaxID=8319 RepID=A0AAV7UEZ4_PLEWA|nr:hypothetical protein NDU88_004310 [Pleurodeles waltl]